jgi:putative colanic acid biosynthesis UDP-glucose lipid carrier transferase
MDVIVATQEHERVRLPELVHGLLGLPVRVLLWPRSCGVEVEWFTHSEYRIGGIPLLLASAPPLDGWRWVLKDSRDRLLAFFLLVCISPVLLGIAVAIRVSSPGPILFRQEREGYNGRTFTIFKFRTMQVAEPPIGELVLTARRDPRVFPLGALLRKTSLDELPQLLNVLRGDMWLVGPRPHSPLATAAGQRYAVAVREYMSRFRVKPGITGWAQVNGWRGPTNTIEQIRQRVAYDRYYIENLTFWLDLQILLRTSIKGFNDYNAF